MAGRKAQDIALEHCIWARRNGFSPRDVIVSIDHPVPENPSWEDALYSVARAWEWVFLRKAAE